MMFHFGAHLELKMLIFFNFCRDKLKRVSYVSPLDIKMYSHLKNYNFLGLPIVATLFLAICPKFLSAETLPRVVTEETISQCKYVTTVEGNSATSKSKHWQDIAKQAALQQAAKIGASHIVWLPPVTITAGSGIVIGKAYRCGL
jgi:hypothetical protein